MSTKKFAYIRNNIPEDSLVPTSVGYENKATGKPIIEHGTLYPIIPHGDEFDDEEFSLHLEVNGFTFGVFVNHGDFDFLEVELPNKEVNFDVRFEEMRAASISVMGKNREEIMKRYQAGEFDEMIAIAMNEQHELSFQQMFFDGGIDEIERWV